MKKYAILGTGLLAAGLMSGPAWAQNPNPNPNANQIPAHKAGDLPGPIDSLADLQDTGRMIFKLADENNDGQISQKEAVDAGNLVVGGFFFRADQNGDGVLSKEEAKQARDAFLATKPWLKYVIETAKSTPNTAATQGNNPKNPQVALNNLEAVFDTNNDKQLQATELRQAVQTTIQGLFAAADTNRDNELSTSEVNAGLAGIARQAGQAVFAQADTDNNGQISQAEFEKAILEPTRVAFRVADLNHDGQISPQEADTARRVIMSKLQMLNQPEAPNSPRNMINSALGSQTNPAQAAPAAPVNPPTQPR